MTTTLAARFPTGLVQPGRNGYWGASPRTEVLTYALIDAIASGADTRVIVWQIGDELAAERVPTPDEMDWDEAAYERSERDLQQRLWEEFDPFLRDHDVTDPDHVLGCRDGCHWPGCDVECTGCSCSTRGGPCQHCEQYPADPSC